MSFVLGIDEWEYGVVSNCCLQPIYINGICSSCHDSCAGVLISDLEDEDLKAIKEVSNE